MKSLMKVMKRMLKSQGGFVLVLAMAFVGLMLFSVLALGTMIQRDANLIESVKDRAQARYMAEGGINTAIATIQDDGFDPWSTINEVYPDVGEFTVTRSETSGRYMLTSVGEIPNGISATVKIEVQDNTPTALNYFSGAGNNILMKVHTNVDGTITGDMHANNDMNLIVQSHASLYVTGNLSATGTVTEGSKYNQSDNKDKDLYINGVNNDAAIVSEGTTRITFPVLDYMKYREAAEDSDDYYSSNQTFNNETLSPANGIVYVDGDVTINGTVNIYGGLIGDNITIDGTLNQYKFGTRNVIVAKDGNVSMGGRLSVEEGIVFASEDITTHARWGAEVVVNGLMMALEDITYWNFRTDVTYQHVYIFPPDMTEESSGLRIISWNE